MKSFFRTTLLCLAAYAFLAGSACLVLYFLFDKFSLRALDLPGASTGDTRSQQLLIIAMMLLLPGVLWLIHAMSQLIRTQNQNHVNEMDFAANADTTCVRARTVALNAATRKT